MQQRRSRCATLALRGGRGRLAGALLLWGALGIAPACGDVSPTPVGEVRYAGGSGETSPPPRLPAADGLVRDLPFAPLPRTVDLPAERVALGQRLFEEPLLSGTGDRACVDCHDLGAGGVVPGEARSNHPMTDAGPYNVPTVFNVGFNFRYNWQGAFRSLEDHLGGPMLNASVMAAGSWPEVEARLAPTYDADFRAVGYPDGASEAAIKDALATYQRSLVTPDAPFDRYLRGEDALTPAAERGLALFMDVGCASCHQGMNIGGNMFQRFGVVEDAFSRPLVELDYGRMLLTGDPEDAHVFRVPSLRNVAVTGPWFHDGSAATLDDAVRRMARVQLGYDLAPDEVDDLVAFLESLTGTWQGQPLTAPGAP